jgi:hypothetical protein
MVAISGLRFHGGIWLSSFQKRQLPEPTPASQDQSLYSASPLLLRGPAKARCSADTCRADRQSARLSLLHCRSATLNAPWQRGRSPTMPSVAPSSASQRASTWAATSCMSCGLKALRMSGSAICQLCTSQAC